ncbi:hypothetical protein FKM82_003806 [Ascaphus truei]
MSSTFGRGRFAATKGSPALGHNSPHCSDLLPLLTLPLSPLLSRRERLAEVGFATETTGRCYTMLVGCVRGTKGQGHGRNI